MIGIFDSGFGGLSVYLPLRQVLLDAKFLYFADQDFAPYGEKTKAQILERLKKVVNYFLDQEVKMIVLACNTATLNAITELRDAYPTIQFVGMVPAVKPAATEVDKIVVLGTRSTVENPIYHQLVHDHAQGKKLWHIAAPELVRQVEEGDLNNKKNLEEKLKEPLENGAQGLVIGCSHFSFLKDLINKNWPDLKIFDGADGVVRQTIKVLKEDNLHPARLHLRGVDAEVSENDDIFVTTGIPRTADFVSPKINFKKIQL